jgi:hypothetical protein
MVRRWSADGSGKWKKYSGSEAQRCGHLPKTDVEKGHSQASGARLYHAPAYRVHVWQGRYAREGRAGLADRPRGGRPHAPSDADRASLETAPDQGPQAYDLPLNVWSIRDRRSLPTGVEPLAISRNVRLAHWSLP